MRWRWRGTFATVIALLLPWPGWADSPPSLIPSRDVDVTYVLKQAGQPDVHERVRWSAARKIERIDSPQGLATIVDHAKNGFAILEPKERKSIKGVGSPHDSTVVDVESQVSRGGTLHVKGLDCTEWSWSDAEGPNRICVTDDGVLLLAQIGTSTTLKAIKVVYGSLKSSLFDVPLDYEPTILPDIVER